MDISLQFDDDRPSKEIADTSDEVIKRYLRGKIDDLKRLSKNTITNLEEVRKHQNQCLKYLKESEQLDCAYVNITKTWQRVHNGQWIIGICVENSAERAAANTNIILKSNPKQDLTYDIKMYTKFKEHIPEELPKLEKNVSSDLNELLDNIKASFQDPPKWISIQNIEKETTIVITMNIPKFIDFKELELEGILSFEMSTKIYKKQLPEFRLQIQSILSDDLAVKLKNIISGTEEAFLSILSTSQVTRVKIVIPEGLYRTLESILQLDCSFTKIDIVGKEIVLIFDGNSHSLSCCMLKLTPGTHDMELVTKNEEQLYLLYHHLYTNIPDVIILNENCEQIIDNSVFVTRPTQSFLEPVKQDQSTLKNCIDSFDEQLILLEKKVIKSNKNKKSDTSGLILSDTQEDYKLFRTELTDLEKKTDELFLKVFDKKM